MRLEELRPRCAVRGVHPDGVVTARNRDCRVARGAANSGNGGRITATCGHAVSFHCRHNPSIIVVATASSCSAVSSVCALAPPTFPNAAVVVS